MEFAGAERTFVLEATRGTEASEAIVPIATEIDLGTIVARGITVIVVNAVTTRIVTRMVVATAGTIVTSIASGLLTRGRGDASRTLRRSSK